MTARTRAAATTAPAAAPRQRPAAAAKHRGRASRTDVRRGQDQRQVAGRAVARLPPRPQRPDRGQDQRVRGQAELSARPLVHRGLRRLRRRGPEADRGRPGWRRARRPHPHPGFVPAALPGHHRRGRRAREGPGEVPRQAERREHAREPHRRQVVGHPALHPRWRLLGAAERFQGGWHRSVQRPGRPGQAARRGHEDLQARPGVLGLGHDRQPLGRRRHHAAQRHLDVRRPAHR